MKWTPGVMKEKYLQELRLKNLSGTSVKKASGDLSVFMNFLRGRFAVKDIREVTKEHIEEYISYLLVRKSRNTGKVITEGYRYSLIRDIMQWFMFLEKNEFILKSPADWIEVKPAKRAFPRDILSEEEVRDLLDAPDIRRKEGYVEKAILEVLYGSGLRNFEVRNLRIRDLDMENSFLCVSGKGGKDRVVPLTKAAVKYIKLYLERSRRRWLKKRPDEPGLFLNCMGRPLGKHYINKMIKRCVKKLEMVKNVSAHSLRHTCATHLIANGAGVRYVQELLGHSLIDSTQIYTRVMPINLQEVYEKCHPRCAGIKKGRPRKY